MNGEGFRRPLRVERPGPTGHVESRARWWRSTGTSVIASVVLLGAVVGCSGPDSTAGLSDNGGQVHVSGGDVFDVVLPSDYARSNGQWHDKQTNDWDILRPLGSQYDPQRALPGHPDTGTFTARFKAVNSGTTKVTLVQEDNSNPPTVAGRYTLDVIVD